MSAPAMSDARIRREINRPTYPVRLVPFALYGDLPAVSGYMVQEARHYGEFLCTFLTREAAVAWCHLEDYAFA